MADDAEVQAPEPEQTDPVADAATESTENQAPTQPGEAADAEPAESSTEKPKHGAQDRIDELTGNWRRTERERDYWREQATAAQRQEPDPPPAEREVKTLADFADEDDPERAWLDWAHSDISTAATEAARREIVDADAREQGAQRNAEFADRQTEFAKEKADYFDVVRNPALPISDAVAGVAVMMETGPAVLYHLGKNPREAEQISMLPPLQAAVELGRIDATLKAQKKAAADTSQKVSNAPDPPPKIDGSGSGGKKHWSQMSDQEYANWRRKGGKATAKL